jgi:hypothetical protein
MAALSALPGGWSADIPVALVPSSPDADKNVRAPIRPVDDRRKVRCALKVKILEIRRFLVAE